MVTINIKERFRIQFAIDKSKEKKITDILIQNKFEFTVHNKTPITSFYTVHVGIRSAELCRQLLNNITTYDK